MEWSGKLSRTYRKELIGLGVIGGVTITSGSALNAHDVGCW
jgi:hypothetical protein